MAFSPGLDTPLFLIGRGKGPFWTTAHESGEKAFPMSSMLCLAFPGGSGLGTP